MGNLLPIDSEIKKLSKAISFLDICIASNNVSLSKPKGYEESLKEERVTLTSKLNKLKEKLKPAIIPEKKNVDIKEKLDEPPKAEQKMPTQSLPLSTHSYSALKGSRKSLGIEHSQFRIYKSDALEPSMEFAVEHDVTKSYPSGSCAERLKKGYLIGTSAPKYAVKIYRRNIFNNTVHEERIAMRAAYCYKLLQQDALTYRYNDKQYLVTNYLDGVNLEEAKQTIVESLPIPKRILMAVNVLRELSVLHHHGIIHNDVKALNLMTNNGQLHLVDMDGAHLKHEVPLYGVHHAYTEAYLDLRTSFAMAKAPQESHLRFCESTDLYALGLSLAYLFPEIYRPSPEVMGVPVAASQLKYQFKTVKLYHGTKYHIHPNLQALIKKMVSLDKEKPLTAQDYIKSFLEVLKTYPDHEKYLRDDKTIPVPGRSSEACKADTLKAFQAIEAALLFREENRAKFISNFSNRKLK